MQSWLQDPATEVRLGILTSLSFHANGDRNPYATCARTAGRALIQPRRRLARNPHRLEFRALARERCFPAPRRSAGRSRLSLTESALRAVGPDLDLGRRPELRHHQGAPLAFGAGSDTVQPAPGDRRTAFAIGVARAIPAGKGSGPTAAVRVHRAPFWNAAVRHWHRPDGIYTNANSHSASHSGSTANAVVTGGRHEYRI
jgi:hypothetical protein